MFISFRQWKKSIFLFRMFDAIMIEDNFLCLPAFLEFWGKLRRLVWGNLNARLGDVFFSDPLWRIWLKFCTVSTQVILRGDFDRFSKFRNRRQNTKVNFFKNFVFKIDFYTFAIVGKYYNFLTKRPLIFHGFNGRPQVAPRVSIVSWAFVAWNIFNIGGLTKRWKFHLNRIMHAEDINILIYQSWKPKLDRFLGREFLSFSVRWWTKPVIFNLNMNADFNIDTVY